MSDDEKIRITITLTTAQANRFNRILAEMKAQRAVRQTTTINRLVLQLALAQADQREQGKEQAKAKKKA